MNRKSLRSERLRRFSVENCSAIIILGGMVAMATTKSKNATVTVSQAAEELELSPETVRAYCRKGLCGTKIFDVFGRPGYLLSESEVERLKDPANRPANGRPPKRVVS